MLKLIIADDEMRVCQLIDKLVPWKEYGIEVVGVAYNGVDAYNQICKSKPDIVITDIRMPGYDGLELIRKTKEYDESISFIIVSGHRDFEYAQNAIKYGAEDYILKPIVQDELINIINKIINKKVNYESRRNNEILLKNELEKSKEIIREQFGTNLIQSNFELTFNNIEEINDDFSLSFRKGNFQVLIFKYDGVQFEEMDESYITNILQKAQEVIKKKMKALCEESIEVINGLRIVCVMNYNATPEQVKRDLLDLFEQMQNFISSYGNYQITMSVGNVEDSLEKLHLSYKNAALADKHRIIKGTNRIIHFNDCSFDADNKQMIPPIDVEKVLSNPVEQFNIEEIGLRIKELFSRLIQSGYNNNPNEIFDLSERIMDFILVAVEKIGIREQNNHAVKSDILECLDNAVSVMEIEKILKQKVKDYLGGISESKKMQEYKPIRIAKQYVSEKYMESVGLEDIAELVELSPVYFSVIFKKETGTNFKDYVINYRIEKAKELLKTTNNTVQQISGMVGYNDPRYFSKLFTKVVGIKPTRYKKIYG
ncbi:MAG: response regulator [Clostridia bacterium]|nr:response regulator [Clostridia bacterium]